MKIKKILLIWPYVERKKNSRQVTSYNLAKPRFPLGIGYLASYLGKNGYEAEILDLAAENPNPTEMEECVRWGLSDEEIEERIRRSGAQLIGVSQMFSYLDPVCRKIFSMIKKNNPGTITAWGGTHPTCVPRECMECSDVDYIVLGEGEKPLIELIKMVNEGRSPEGMKSLGYRDQEGKTVINNERIWIEDLDEHVLPAREKVDMTVYAGCTFDNIRVFNMVTSRGCPYKCTFCTASTFYQQRYKGRSPLKVVDEMEMLVKKYGAEMIIVDDENLTFDMKRIEQIMDIMIERELKVQWYAEVGLSISRLNRDIISKMKKTGFKELRLALESGDAQMLKVMKKPLVLRQAREAVQWAREADIRVICFLLMGMPGETLEQMQNTVDFAAEIGFDWHVISMVLPLPGTQIYKDLMAKGFKVDLVDLERYTLPVPGVSTIPHEDLIAFREKANNFLNFENNYHLTRGEPLLAIREFSNLAKGYPNLEKIRFFLGLACYKAGNFAEALKDFEHVYKLNPNYRNVAQWVEFLRDDRVYHEGAAFCRSREEFLNYSYGHIATEKPASVSLNA